MLMVPTGGCSLPAGSYSFILLDWFLLVVDDHNKVAYLEKGKGWEAYEPILDFLNRSHIRFIMDEMIGNIGSKRHKFLMYLRFLQMILGIQTTDPSPRPTFDFTAKLFSNIKLNWDGPHMPLLAPILVVPAAGDGVDAVAAGAAGTHNVFSPSVPPTHSSSSIPGPFSAPQEPSPMREPSPVREPSLVREPTPVQEPTPRPVREPTPDSPRPPFPPSRTDEVGPTTSTRPPSPTRQSSFHADISEGGGDFGNSPKSNEALQTPAATAVGGVEDPAALTALSFKLDSKSLGGDSTDKAASHNAAEVLADSTMPFRRRRLRKPFTSFHSTQILDTILAGADIPAASTTIPVGSSIDDDVYAAAAPSSSIPAVDKGKSPMVDDSLPADLLSEQERRRRELDAAQLIYTKADWVELLAKIATNSALSKHLLGDDVTEDKMNERLEVSAAASRPADTPTAHASVEHSVVATTPSSSCKRRKHIAKKRVTPIMDMANADLIKFDSDSGSDDDPLPYAPYAGWKMVPSPLGSVHAYSDMAGHTKHFTSLRELLHISLDDKDAYDFWCNQDSWRIRSWRLYPRAQVHILEIVDGRVIYMFVYVSYPLSAATLKRILKHGLEVPKLLVGGDLTMAEQLISFIKAALLNAQSAV
nr:hypothetical protein [Tanacetum cinerariifolium]